MQQKIYGLFVIFLCLLGEMASGQYDSDTISFQSMRFFESGHNAVPQSQRQYSSSFSKASSRYIFYELYVKNWLYQVRDNPVQITAHYYYPNGTLFGSPVLNYTISRNWDYAYLWHGWGWPDKGNWTTGKYRVEIFFGDTKVTDAYFTLYEGYYDASSKVAPFPSPSKLYSTGGTQVIWEIENQTSYSIHLLYQGAQNGSLIIPALQTKTLFLAGGSYLVYGYTTSPGVLPYSGSVQLAGGWKYKNSFYIRGAVSPRSF
jgi:hypothetical protein